MQAQGATRPLPRGVVVPVVDDLGAFDEEDPLGRAPVADGQPEPLEVLLPLRLVLARVEEHGRADERDGVVLGRALGDDDVVDEGPHRCLELEGVAPLLADLDLAHLLGQGRAPVVADGLGPAGQQPVAQLEGGDAVVLVVVGDLGDERSGLVVAALGAGGGELVVDDDALRAPLDLALAGVHVEGLELLDRVRALRHPDAGSHDGVEVDEDAVAQQLVDVVLAHAVPGGEPQQRRRLVGRVVVDVQVGPAAAPGGEVLDEVDEGAPLLRPVVGPEGPEPWRAGVDLDHPEEVLQAPGRRPALLPQRVALEVEEDVALAGAGHPAQGVGVDDLVPDAALGVGVLGELEAGLRAEALEHRRADVGDRALVGREVLDGGDPGVEEPAAGGPAHPGDEEEVAVGLDLHLAHGAPPAGQPARVAPPGRAATLEVVGEQPLEAAAPRAVDRQDVGQGDVVHVAPTEHEPGHRSHRDPGAVEEGGVGRDLEQGGDVLVPGQLGVADQPPVVGPLEEVGPPDEPAVEEGGLGEHHGVTRQGVEGGAHRLGQARRGVLRRRQLADPTGVQPAQPAQLGVLVLVAEGRDPGEHRVGGVVDRLAQPPDDVEPGDERELAQRRRAQVARADDEALLVAEEEHDPNLRRSSDNLGERRHPPQIQLGNHIRQCQCS